MADDTGLRFTSLNKKFCSIAPGFHIYKGRKYLGLVYTSCGKIKTQTPQHEGYLTITEEILQRYRLETIKNI